MKSISRTVVSLLSVAAALAAGAAQAQVQASLVAADQSAQPGKPLTVALRLQHDPGWHTYWVNPGIGEATSIQWSLPQGWSAGDIQWPVPHKILGEAGEVTGHGYEGTIYLPVTIEVPKDARVGEQVSLKGKANWLMCSLETCVPGEANVELRLPVAAQAQPNEQIRAALSRVPMPRAADGWKVKASSDGKTITLKIAGAQGVQAPHFFPATEMISYDAQQKHEASGNELTVTLPIDEYYSGDKNALSGVLAFKDASGEYVGVSIEAPLS